jgi:hypothetical protein
MLDKFFFLGINGKGKVYTQIPYRWRFFPRYFDRGGEVSDRNYPDMEDC